MQTDPVPDKVVDPICGMGVDPATALPAERDGQTYYFCSARCRQKFLSAPVAAKPPPSQSRKAIYTCPMHPEVEQDHPGACPKCGMALELKIAGAAGDDGDNAERRGRRRDVTPGSTATPLAGSSLGVWQILDRRLP